MNILALLDEMFCTSLNKINMFDGIFSFVDVNERLDQLAIGSLCIHVLDFVIQQFIFD